MQLETFQPSSPIVIPEPKSLKICFIVLFKNFEREATPHVLKS